MAFASITYTSASGTTFALTNSDGNAIEYLRQSDIAVTVNGTLQTLTTDYTFNAAGTSIVLNSAVSSATVVITRTTSITDATVSFTAGSTLTAQDLNNSDRQNRFALQEFSDTYGALTTGTGDLEILAGFIGSTETWDSDNAHAATTGAIDSRIDSKIDDALTDDISGGDGVTIVDDSPASGQIRIDLDADIATLRNMQAGAATTLAGLTSAELAILDDATVTTTELNQLDGNTLTNSPTWTSSTDFPSADAINSRIVSQLDAVGGFIAIADDQSFPTTNPDPSDNAGTVVSVADAGGLVIDSSGETTTGRTTGGDTVTITGFPTDLRSTTFTDGLGLQVQTTTTLHTYTYHKIIAKEADVIQLSQDIEDFGNRYRVAASNPTTDNDEGDLVYNTTDDVLRVFDGTNWVTAATGNASNVGSTAAGNISATNVQAALEELDTEKLALTGGTLTGDITLNAQSDVRFADSDSSNYVAFQAPATIGSNVTWTLPNADATIDGHALVSDGAGNLSWSAAGGGATGGGTDKIFQENGQTVTTNYTVGTTFGDDDACNAFSAGPITINSGITVTINSGSRWVII